MKARIIIFSALTTLALLGSVPDAVAQTPQKKGQQALPGPAKIVPAKSAAADSLARAPDATEGQDFRIDQPGTITFKVGVTIKGKIEKPQVMIFLPKEKSYYKKINFTHSFKNDLLEPLPFVPLQE